MSNTPTDEEIDDFLDSPAGLTWVIAANRERYRLLVRAVLAKWGTPPAMAGEPLAKLWLWKNFVGGKPEYWAFDNPFPCVSVGGDPLTLGEPCGWALFKPSINGRPQHSEQEVVNKVYRLHTTPPPTQAQAGAVPLTDTQIDDLIAAKHFRKGYELTASDKVCINWYRLGLRDGERAHGITQKGDQHVGKLD